MFCEFPIAVINEGSSQYNNSKDCCFIIMRCVNLTKFARTLKLLDYMYCAS